MSHLSAQVREHAQRLVELYPDRRSALLPICHIAQAQDGWLRPEAMEEIAELVGVSPAEVLGTASFYDMLYTEPVGRYVVAICTNIACMLDGAYELIEHAKGALGVGLGGTTPDGLFTLEEAECLAGCDMAPCVQVNHRYVGKLDPEGFDVLVDDLRAGRKELDIPAHGVLCRVEREVGLATRAMGHAGVAEASKAQIGQGSTQGTGRNHLEDGSGAN